MGIRRRMDFSFLTIDDAGNVLTTAAGADVYILRAGAACLNRLQLHQTLGVAGNIANRGTLKNNDTFYLWSRTNQVDGPGLLLSDPAYVDVDNTWQITSGTWSGSQSLTTALGDYLVFDTTASNRVNYWYSLTGGPAQTDPITLGQIADLDIYVDEPVVDLRIEGDGLNTLYIPNIVTGRTGKWSSLEFSAQADGTTDDTGSLKAAIDAAEDSDDKIVNIPSGTYLIDETLDLPAGVVLEGDGTSTVIKTTTDSLTMISPSGADTSVRNLRLLHSASTKGIGISSTVRETKILNVEIDGASIGVQLSSLAIENQVRACTIENCTGNGITLLTGVTRNILDGNIVRDNGGWGLQIASGATGNIYVSNVFNNNTSGGVDDNEQGNNPFGHNVGA